MPSFFRLLHLVVIVAALPLAASSAPKAVGKYKDWSVFTEARGGETVCYAASEASSKSPRTADHGNVFYYVTYWKGEPASAQPSFKVGYPLKEDRAPKTRVGRSSWSMFAAGQEAFGDDKDDPRIIDALRKGADLKVEAMSERGTSVSYTFSLSGSADAIEAAAEACG